MAQGPNDTSVDPLWYKDAIIYELHVKTFCDSDDGDDIADYLDINPNFGTLDDFRALLDAAHQRNLRVITELVINHTSDQNPWFQKSRRAVAAAAGRINEAGHSDDPVYKDFYVWSNTPEKYKDARIIFKDFETSNWAWDPV